MHFSKLQFVKNPDSLKRVLERTHYFIKKILGYFSININKFGNVYTHIAVNCRNAIVKTNYVGKIRVISLH